MTIRLEPLNKTLIDATARLHIAEMPRDLSSRLGLSVVRDLFHQGMLDDPDTISLVAIDGEQVAGFAFAQMDFAQFAQRQRQKRFRYAAIVIRALLKKPWLLFDMFNAKKYLGLEEHFINYGPLVVASEYRNADVIQQKGLSVATLLTAELFHRLKEKRTKRKILTMIRPNNFQSITAVALGARKAGFQLASKRQIQYFRDPRIVFEYQESGDAHG